MSIKDNNLLSGMSQLPAAAWGRIGTGTNNISAAALYEYGKIRLLHQGNEVNVSPVYWGKASFNCIDPIWGLEFEWVKDMEAGYRFLFGFRFDILPDIILVDNKIRWTRSRNETSLDKVSFSYVPEKSGPARLTFLKDYRYRASEDMDKGIRFGDLSGCIREACCDFAKYKPYDQISELITTDVPPIVTDHDFFNETLVKPDLSEIPQVQWQTMQVKVLNETVDSYWPALAHFTDKPSEENISHLIGTIPVLEANGMDGMMLYHLTDDLLDALEASKLRHFLVQTCSAGEWWGPTGSDIHVSRPQYDIGLEICNRLQERIQDCHVYIWFPEIDERQRDILISPEIKAHIHRSKHGLGNLQIKDTIDNEFWIVDLFDEHNTQWKHDYWNKIKYPDRATAVYQAGNQFMITGFKNSGSDLTVNKNIFRACMNTTIAAGRGTMKAHKQPHGYDYDPHCWHFKMNHHPDEWRQGIKAYLHAGCSFLFHEGILLQKDSNGEMKTSEIGLAFFESVRYARKHPSVGHQIAKMAVMQGSGDHTRCYLPRFMPQCATEFGHPVDWMGLRFSDWDLLDVFFPKLGNWIVGNYERMMTGTPYGPLDIIPPDTDYDVMKNYDFVALLGTNGCSEVQIETFKKYVSNGGTMVLSLGQLRNRESCPRQVISADLTDIAGITIDLESGEISETSAKEIYKFSNGESLLLNKFGAGQVYFFTTNTLTSMGQEQPRKVLKELGKRAAFVDFEPFSDWLEIMVNQKGQAVSLCVFNHGMVGFPSGNGCKSDPWSGKISVDLSKIDIYGEDIVVCKVENACELKTIQFQIVDESIVFEDNIGFLSEFVIAPREKLNDWFGAI